MTMTRFMRKVGIMVPTLSIALASTVSAVDKVGCGREPDPEEYPEDSDDNMGWRTEAGFDECTEDSDEWWCRYEQEGFLSLSLVHDDDHLAGASVGYGTRGYFLEGLRWKTWSLAYQSKEAESVWAGRRDWAILMPYAMRWGGIGPLVAFGLEYCTGELQPGFGGYVGLGGQVTIWTRGHWQFAIVLEHDFGIS